MNTPKLAKRLAANRGFTLVEMVITVAVLAILLAISFPSIYQFISNRDELREHTAQLEIRKAMEAYLADKGSLPSDTGNWAEDLAGYTNLSADDIANDVWGNPRMYVEGEDSTRNIQGTTVPVLYATVLSMGVNGEADKTYKEGATVKNVDGVAFSSAAGKTIFGGATSHDWWSYGTSAQVVDAFAALHAGGDDIFTRLTDYPQKLDAYNKTLDRLDRISKALETYGRNGYAETISANCGGATPPAACTDGTYDNRIYYPKAIASYSTGDSATYNNNTVIVDNRQSADTRRTQMKNLMRILGLPDEFCCSAISVDANGNPMPFYYFSNPRPRNAGSGCGARPSGTARKLPARLTTTNNADSASDATCG